MSQEVGSCSAIIYKVQSLLDGSARVSFDIPAMDAKIAAKLLSMKLESRELVQLGIIEVDPD